ncbi:hypothetical protein Bhyg_12023 [Pseudolycoriella hygida]|uniref:DUF7726 domain-containing protein n=1 Tax=Pseudolycoriella hygida TaxID=35572 RepID=A0A9Q0MWR9_9DIPT|nr:hypothetical protein Bhyg_12023 [Pseudolycoriella hygida]
MDMDESLHLSIRDERYSDRSNSHGTTNDTRSVGGYCEPPSQSAVFYNFPNVHQTQRQFAAPNSFPYAFDNITNAYQSRWQFDAYRDISNAFESQDEIVAPSNNQTVNQPLGQIAVPGNCINVSEPQSLSDSDISDFLDQFLSEFGAPSDDANVILPHLQDGAPNGFPNDNQPQRQFDTLYDIPNASEQQYEIVAPYNNPTVCHPLGQIAVPGNCTNVSEPQSLSDSDISDFLDQFLSEFGAPSDDANVILPHLQDGAPNGFPNDNQPQRQFDTLYDIPNASEQQYEIVAPYNNPTVCHPLGQIAASANCPNVSEPQSLSDAPDILQQLDDIPNSANSPKIFDRQSVRRFERLYGPVFDDCEEVRRKIKEYIFKISAKESTFARAIKVHHRSLIHFLGQEGSNRGAGNIAYPAAYYYFEKMRIAHHEEKSEHRKCSEKRFPNGYELTRDYVPT